MGLLGNAVLQGLLAGPETIRAAANQRMQAMLPRGGGGMMGAPAAIVRPQDNIGAGLAGLGQGLAAMGRAREAAKAQEQAKSSLERVLGLQSGGDAIAQNVSMGGRAGPTVAAADTQNSSNLMGLSPGVVQAARMAYDSGDYVGGLGVIQKAMLQQPEEYTLSPGETRFRGGKPVASVAPTVDKTTAVKNAEALGYAPGSPAFKNYVERVTAPSSPTVNVSVDTPMERAEQSGRGSDLAARGKAMFEAGQAASSQIPALEMALTIADTSETGEPLPSVLQERAGTLLQALGFNTESGPFSRVLGNVTSGQSFNALMQNAVLTKMQAQKGPQTESDTRLIRQTVANLGNTPEARNFLLRSALALARRDVEKSSFYENHWAENGTYDGAERAWQTEMARVPLFGVNPKSNIPVFFSEFMERARAANPDMSEQEIRQKWIERYGRRVR